MTANSRGVLDTSAVLLLGLLTADALPAESLITTITLAELSIGPLVAREDDERVIRQAHLQQAEADFEALPLDSAAARAFGRVASDLRRAGRKPSPGAYDALIAAVALSADLPWTPLRCRRRPGSIAAGWDEATAGDRDLVRVPRRSRLR